MHDDTHAIEDTGIRVRRRGPGWHQEGVVGYCLVCRRFYCRGGAVEEAAQALTPRECNRLNAASERQRRRLARSWLALNHPEHVAGRP